MSVYVVATVDVARNSTGWCTVTGLKVVVFMTHVYTVNVRLELQHR